MTYLELTIDGLVYTININAYMYFAITHTLLQAY
jgi:hypothetical protein